MTQWIQGTTGLVSEVYLIFWQIWNFGFIYAWIDWHARKAYERGFHSSIPKLQLYPTQVSIQSVQDIGPVKGVVIIPCLCKTLDHLEDLTLTLNSFHEYPDLSVLVYIDGPSPYLDDIFNLFKNKATFICGSVQRGAAFGRNQCLDHLESLYGANSIEKAAFIDAGVIPTVSWFEAFLDLKGDDTVISGATLSYLRNDRHPLFDMESTLKWYYDRAGTLNARIIKKTNTVLYAPTCNMIIPQKAFKIRFIQEVFTDAGFEDVEYCIRLKKAYNINVIVRKDFLAYHHFREKYLADMEKRFYRYGLNHAKFSLLYPDYEKDFNETKPLDLSG